MLLSFWIFIGGGFPYIERYIYFIFFSVLHFLPFFSYKNLFNGYRISQKSSTDLLPVVEDW
jgi:hypothetical protein